MDEMFRELERLRQYGTMLQNLANEFAEAAPEHSEGTDPSGAVRVAVGADGLPETIRVSSYWNQKLKPDAFAGAVNAACIAAVQRRGVEWTEKLTRSGWQNRIAEVDQDATAAAAATAADPNPVPPAYRRPNGTPPRPMTDLAEEAISLLGTATSEASMLGPPRIPQGTGANRHGTLEISVSSEGQVVCRADPQWVAQQSGAELSMALSSTLATARERLAAAVSAAAASAPGASMKSAADNLQREIREAMSDLQGLL